MNIHKHGSSSEHTFMSGVLVLTASTVIVKIIGLAYKIPLISILGAEGMGYFNTAYEIFALLCGVSTSGMPVAVSMLVSSARESGNYKRARGIYNTGSALLFTKGVLFSGFLAVFAEPIAHAVGNPKAYFAILAISPSIVFACASGAIRGYFQGCRLMTPTAVSQLTEALGKLIFGVAFAAVGMHYDIGVAASAALGVFGVSLGGFVSTVYLRIRKQNEFGITTDLLGQKDKTSRYVFALLRISLPITLCSALIGTTRIIDMTLMLTRLQSIGVSASEANKIYGAYTTLALPVFGLVPAFIPPITESLIPRLAAAVETGAKEEQGRAVSAALRLTVFVAMPASFGIIIYSKQILSLLFSGEPTSVAICAPLLSVLGVSVLFSCLITTSNAVLQSYRKVFLPIISLAVGAAAKAVSAYLLIGDPEISEMGAPLSTLISNAVVMLLNAVFMCKAVKGKTGLIISLIKPFFASIAAMTLSYLLFEWLLYLKMAETVAFVNAFVIAVILYLVMAFAMGIVKKDEFPLIRKTKNGE